MSGIEHYVFGVLPDGQKVDAYTLRNDTGISLRVASLGCTLLSLQIPDRNGNAGEVLLGFDTLEEYMASPHYVGCIIGRYANRIAHGQFSLEGQMHQLSCNEGAHHLHGGFDGLNKKIWTVTPLENENGQGLDLIYKSEDGEEGYPGNLYIHVHIFLAHENVLFIHYALKSDAPTIANITHHPYFNLAGENVSALNHMLMLSSDHYLPMTGDKIPVGEIKNTTDTPFDFSKAKRVIDVFDTADKQIQIAGGIDHCFVISGDDNILRHAASLMELTSGRIMEVFTTYPGLQVYTGNFLDGKGRQGVEYTPYGGIALEPQYFPDAPNQALFKTPLIAPGEVYTESIMYRFPSPI